MRDRQVTTNEAEIRGVRVRLRKTLIDGHVVEMSLCYRISDAESVYEKTWDNDLDHHLAMGMAAVDRIAADETLRKAVAAEPRVLDGICCREAKIERCKDVAPGSHYWIITKADGTRVEPGPYSCVTGTPPADHNLLTKDAEPQRAAGFSREEP